MPNNARCDHRGDPLNRENHTGTRVGEKRGSSHNATQGAPIATPRLVDRVAFVTRRRGLESQTVASRAQGISGWKVGDLFVRVCDTRWTERRQHGSTNILRNSSKTRRYFERCRHAGIEKTDRSGAADNHRSTREMLSSRCVCAIDMRKRSRDEYVYTNGFRSQRNLHGKNMNCSMTQLDTIRCTGAYSGRAASVEISHVAAFPNKPGTGTPPSLTRTRYRDSVQPHATQQRQAR